MSYFGYEPIFSDREFGGEYICSLWTKSSLLKTTIDVSDSFYHGENDFYSWKSNLLDKLSNNSIIWGGGGKGVMLTNILKLNYNSTPFVIDLNKSIHGKFISGNGISIMPYEVLKEYPNHQIINLNSLYNVEIKNLLQNDGINNIVVDL
jgi:hypothetical protein